MYRTLPEGRGSVCGHDRAKDGAPIDLERNLVQACTLSLRSIHRL
jgi:hypothetical protein